MIASDSSPKDLLTFEATQADSAFDAGFLDDAGTLEPKEVIHVDDTIPSTPTFSTEERFLDSLEGFLGAAYIFQIHAQALCISNLCWSW